MPPQLTGIYVPNIVPYSDGGEINEDELRRIIRWLGDKGLRAFIPMEAWEFPEAAHACVNKHPALGDSDALRRQVQDIVRSVIAEMQ